VVVLKMMIVIVMLMVKNNSKDLSMDLSFGCVTTVSQECIKIVTRE
jgi:hypothetical protein